MIRPALTTSPAGRTAPRNAPGGRHAQDRLPPFQGRVLLPCLALLLLLLTAGSAHAQELVLGNLVLDNQAGNIGVRFSLSLDRPDEMTEMLKEGGAMALRCTAFLARKRGWWADETLAEASFESRLLIDGLTREYVVEMPGLKQPYRAKKLKDALDATWAKASMDLCPLDALKRGQDYVVELDVSLKYADVPRWLRRALFFWSWNVAPAVRYEMEFHY